MKERPIIFSGPMVRAIIEGRKTQTRRVVKPQPEHGMYLYRNRLGNMVWGEHFNQSGSVGIMANTRCPYVQPGDRLWVKETWQEHAGQVCYRAGIPPFTHDCCQFVGHLWRPSIHMPSIISRLTLEVVSVRVERLVDISDADAKAEGYQNANEFLSAPWATSVGPNPWCWVVEFKKSEAP